MMRWPLILIFLSATNAFTKTLPESLVPIFEDVASKENSSLASISFHTGDYNYDDIEDVLALYTLETIGGNAYSQHIALMVGEVTGGYRVYFTEVGDKTTLTVTYKYFKDGIFHFDTNYIKDDDPFCCPSGVGVLFMTFVPNELALHDTDHAARMTQLRYLHSRIEIEKNTLLTNKTSYSRMMCQVAKFIPYNALFTQFKFQSNVNFPFNIPPTPANLYGYFASSNYPEQLKFVDDVIDAVEQTPNLIGGRGCSAHLIDVLNKTF
ncbi:hypothetical protein RII68_000897 [Vibrio parahaemolyticus]|nr:MULTISPECIES: hypothetical protein [Vibrio harveyi group]MCG9766330.1 hypothetical protein [Vibrio alginolyticus]EJI1373736.1 hypothetical protein [Vibrio parahaemolyticus]ELC0704536.1 hypothetical protein [Vibrio parahaemolyticus]HCG5245668.1 hypothetical protein [Vibrio parahaemolyticus]HCG5250318.1 hypothetical protein [Vibrio parahaemolyticus]